MFDKAEEQGNGEKHVYQIHGKTGGGDYEDADQETTFGVKDYEVPVSSKDAFNHNVCPWINNKCRKEYEVCYSDLAFTQHLYDLL